MSELTYERAKKLYTLYDEGQMRHLCALRDVEIGRLRDENTKLRELMVRMAEALGIDCEWADPNWCKSPCVLEFGCWPNDEHAEIRCPAWAAMHELVVEVD